METNNEIWSDEGPTFGPPQYYNNIIIYVYVYYVWWTRLRIERRRRIKRGAHAMCSHIIIIRNPSVYV